MLFRSLFGGHSAELAATPMPEPTVSDGAVSTIDRPILSADPTDRMTCRSTYNPHEVRLGNGLVKLVDFEIVVDGIVDPPVIPKHAEVELLVKLYFSEALHRVSFGFALVSVDGVYVAGTNSEMANGPYLTADAGKCLLVRLRWCAHLVGGEYFLNVGCHYFLEGEKTFLDVRRSLAKLKIADTPNSYGFVDLEYSVSVESPI